MRPTRIAAPDAGADCGSGGDPDRRRRRHDRRQVVVADPTPGGPARRASDRHRRTDRHRVRRPGAARPGVRGGQPRTRRQSFDRVHRGRSTSGDTLAPESERDVRRGIEPRMRERRLAVKRAQGRKRLKWAAVVVGVVVVVVGALAVLGSSLFAVRADKVSITGAVYTDPGRAPGRRRRPRGTPALLVDTQAAERRLEAIPWVDDARVTRRLPARAPRSRSASVRRWPRTRVPTGGSGCSTATAGCSTCSTATRSPTCCSPAPTRSTSMPGEFAPQRLRRRVASWPRTSPGRSVVGVEIDRRSPPTGRGSTHVARRRQRRCGSARRATCSRKLVRLETMLADDPATSDRSARSTSRPAR